jgi:hypothetical protein
MTESVKNRELTDRLELIQTMISEGRRKTESWGWTFLLWGVAYYVAIFWSAWSIRPWSWPTGLYGNGPWIWPITMFSAAGVTLLISARVGKGKPNTGVGRAISSVWGSVGISMMLLFPALGVAGRLDSHAFFAIVAAMLGVANGTSGFLLKWPHQIATAVLWWATSVLTCLGSEQFAITVFLVALFFCQIVFGTYAMLREAKARKQLEARNG